MHVRFFSFACSAVSVSGLIWTNLLFPNGHVQLCVVAEGLVEHHPATLAFALAISM